MAFHDASCRAVEKDGETIGLVGFCLMAVQEWIMYRRKSRRWCAFDLMRWKGKLLAFPSHAGEIRRSGGLGSGWVSDWRQTEIGKTGRA
jgi:hypothetical protein